jgi:hypothetical protein
MAPPSSREKSCVPGSPFGQAHVLPMTKAAKRPGWRRRDGEADRAAPVLDHHRQVAEVQPQDELLEDIGVLGRREAVARCRRGEAEAGVVDGDAAVAIAKPLDDLAIEERPGRVAVQKQQRRSAALVDVVEA